MVLVDVQGDPIEILDKLLRPIVDFKENLINGKLTGHSWSLDKGILDFNKIKDFQLIRFFIIGAFGKGKCGCPCRTYWVPKCEVSYVQQCHYDHYQNQVRLFN